MKNIELFYSESDGAIKAFVVDTNKETEFLLLECNKKEAIKILNKLKKDLSKKLKGKNFYFEISDVPHRVYEIFSKSFLDIDSAIEYGRNIALKRKVYVEIDNKYIINSEGKLLSKIKKQFEGEKNEENKR